MEKEQALNICTTDEQKKVVERSATMCARTGREPFYEIFGNGEELLKAINEKINSKEKSKKDKSVKKQINDVVNKAVKAGLTTEEIIKAIKRYQSTKEEIEKLKEQQKALQAQIDEKSKEL